ncbi:MAG TPA: type II toxin-antitoxin system Phd/YefM family antitoxin [Candidatus Acidoferrales bacterium]|nr:type II toxin-antitoxin system Phd/YefM family antitoxin [Candidatus Acidoferrales bacterium]
MRKISAGLFKAQCLKVMSEVKATGEPVTVTKRGKPVVKVVPAESDAEGIFGFLADKFDITGDIESPLIPARKWKITRE